VCGGKGQRRRCTFRLEVVSSRAREKIEKRREKRREKFK
jgi:hypothetical protein